MDSSITDAVIFSIRNDTTRNLLTNICSAS